MSNVCLNWIEIIGDKEVITRLFESVRSDARDWGKVPSSNETEEENRKWLGLEFDFNKVIPYPEEFAKMDAEKENSGYQAGGYEWCIENWGSKWNATNAGTEFTSREDLEEVEGFKLSDYDDPTYAVISFETAWAPALPVTAALSKQFPELSFKHSYEEEGLIGAGYQVWKDGERIAEEEPRDEWDDDEDFEDGDEDFDEDDDEDEDEE